MHLDVVDKTKVPNQKIANLAHNVPTLWAIATFKSIFRLVNLRKKRCRNYCFCPQKIRMRNCSIGDTSNEKCNIILR